MGQIQEATRAYLCEPRIDRSVAIGKEGDKQYGVIVLHIYWFSSGLHLTVCSGTAVKNQKPSYLNTT